LLRAITLLTIVLTFLLINLGGYVHNTGSSLACPDWPLCYGQVMPKMEGGVLIEHSHRMLASLVGFLTIIISFLLYKKEKGNPLRKWGFIALIMVIVQGILGGLTVIFKLPSLVSTFHLGLSMIYFATLVYIYHKLTVKKQVLSEEEKVTWNLNLKTLSFFTLTIVYFQMVLGALMRHLGLGGACGVGYENSVICFDMIEFVQGWLPVSSQAQLHATHRYLGVIAGIATFITSFFIFKNHKNVKNRNIYFNTIFITIMVVVQILLGVMTVGSNIGQVITTLHLGGAALLFAFSWKNYLEMKSLERHNNLHEKHSTLGDLISLTKPRLSALVIFTCAIGLFLAPGEITFFKSIVAIFSTSFIVAGACVINCYMERDIDRLMNRTKLRPLPSDRMNPNLALVIGMVLLVVFHAALFLLVNPLTGILGMAATLLYTHAYTPLKLKSPIALFVGAIPGAIPPVMGWTAVTNSISYEVLIIFAILYVWQLPHFLSISLFYQDDYDAANIKVHPLVKGLNGTKIRIALFTFGLMIVSLLPGLRGVAQQYYLIVAGALSLLFFAYSVYGLFIGQNEEQNRLWAKKYFVGSIIYLPSIYTLLLIFQ
jgi:protoheme IX farnesyltransferase